MHEFPIAWDDGGANQEIPSGACPYRIDEIEGYLRNCHHHLSVEESATDLSGEWTRSFANDDGQKFLVV